MGKMIEPDEMAICCLQCKPGEGGVLQTSTTGGSSETGPEGVALCDKCAHRQQERKETIYEIIETEINYGRDLRILKEEFYVPMQTTGLLTPEQLDTVFVNLDDLLTVNTQLTERLRSALHSAAKACDQDLNCVNIGSIFVESSTMFLAFEKYCVNQAQASASLEQLERERELLRIFLQVSQTDNSVLRRMHLKSFLMVPVQRIMKYPLLLNRLHKATPSHHNDKDNIRQAREKIEDILGHINAKAKGSAGSVRIKRKQSEMHRYSLTEKIEVNRVALEVLGWSQKEAVDLITSRMWYAQPSDHTWATKRCRNIKFTPVHAVLLAYCQSQNNNNNNMVLGEQAAMVLVREKSGKYQPVRDPFFLEKSVVTVDPDCDEVFELQEWGREAYIFKAEDVGETRQWVQHLRQQTTNLGQWRRRRNAMPNIMLKNK
ncbi:intersectin-2-like [Babylonia areolata]|uniref:intersectin-2-like n=1 Tax=Babylonia areolata TaxID=304850 RepID=UPI003FD161EF